MALLYSPTIVNELSVLIFGIAHVILLGFFLYVIFSILPSIFVLLLPSSAVMAHLYALANQLQYVLAQSSFF